MPLTAITSTITSINAAKDIIKAMVSLNTIAEVNQKAIELQSIIIDLQSRIFEIQQSHSAIEDELTNINNWEMSVARNYHLHEPKSGQFVYASNEPMKNNEPAHWICPACYQNRKKSILQCTRNDAYWHNFNCSNKTCGFNISINIRPEEPRRLRTDIII
jgi:hypothetical protein